MNKTFNPKDTISVSPYLIVNGAQRMIDLLKKIFDAIRDNDLKTKKGPVFQTAILVGIMGARKQPILFRFATHWHWKIVV